MTYFRPMVSAGFQNYRLWLQQEFIQRCKRNPAYSLRAFAGLLDLDSSTTSQILSGKRNASHKQVAKLCDRLGVGPAQKKLLIESASKKRKTLDLNSETPVLHSEDYHQISEDAFTVIADWYHYAILELTFVKGFKSTPLWISKRLGLSTPEVQIAIERLIRLRLLEKTSKGFKKTDRYLTNFGEEVTTPALRLLQQHVLKLAFEALESVSVQKRDMSSMTMAINTDKIPQAKELITKFRRSLCALMEQGPRTQVYHLGIQLYPVTKTDPKEGTTT